MRYLQERLQELDTVYYGGVQYVVMHLGNLTILDAEGGTGASAIVYLAPVEPAIEQERDELLKVVPLADIVPSAMNNYWEFNEWILGVFGATS